MKHWLGGFILFLFGMLSSAILFLVTSPPRGQGVELLPAPTAAPLIVQVDGSVQHPGVYRLPREARVGDAIKAAGGLQPDANQSLINLAARVKDGEKVIILSINTQDTSVPVVNSTGQPSHKVSSLNTPAVSAADPINLNTATLEELQQLPGIGPTRAQQIIDYRQAHNGFQSIDELQDVNGIGPATFEKLKDLITVD